eukprot:jgi/Mesen1/10089/ME000074S09429
MLNLLSKSLLRKQQPSDNDVENQVDNGNSATLVEGFSGHRGLAASSSNDGTVYHSDEVTELSEERPSTNYADSAPVAQGRDVGGYVSSRYARFGAENLNHYNHEAAGYYGASPADANVGSWLPSSALPLNGSAGPAAPPVPKSGWISLTGYPTSPKVASGKTSPYSFAESEYQTQLQIALAASTDDVGGEDAAIEAAKLESLGFNHHPADTTAAEAVSYRYWFHHVLHYDDHTVDGFYDVWGLAERLPSLRELRQAPVSRSLDLEVVLVDRAADTDLVRLEDAALAECSAMGGELNIKRAAYKLAELVANAMGGPCASERDLVPRWKAYSWEMKLAQKSNVLPLGSLRVGLLRHRALLFKVLADTLGVRCRLVRGRYYTGMEEGVRSIVMDDDGAEYVVELMGAPGALIPPEAANNTPPQSPSLGAGGYFGPGAGARTAGAGAGAGAGSRAHLPFHTSMAKSYSLPSSPHLPGTPPSLPSFVSLPAVSH